MVEEVEEEEEEEDRRGRREEKRRNLQEIKQPRLEGWENRRLVASPCVI